MSDESRVPRDMRTPITEAETALWAAWSIFIEIGTKLNGGNPEVTIEPDQFFLDQIFKEAWDDPNTNGDKSVKEIGLSLDGKRDSEHEPFALFQVILAVTAYAVQAMKAEKEDEHELAWSYVSDAQYWAGILKAAHAEKENTPNPGKELARIRHAENRVLFEEAIEYWHKEIDPNMSAQKAADKLLTVVPLSHKKLAELISAEKNKVSR